MEAHRARRRAFPAAEVLVGVAATVLLTVLFWVTDLDLRLQAIGYSPSEPHWPYGHREPWSLLYLAGTLPGLALALAAAIGLGVSFVSATRARWRYPCLYVVLLFVLGPGFVVNILGKALAGRPRPGQILEFGGLLEFHRPFQLGTPAKGFSFLCGHCSMGLLFLAFFFLLRGRKRWLALAGALLLGLVQGIGRTLQGAHFPSDALLGATVMFTLAAALSPVARPTPGPSLARRSPWTVAAVTAAVVALLVVGFLFSTPVSEEAGAAWLRPGQALAPRAGETVLRWPASPEPVEVKVEIERGDIVLDRVQGGAPLEIRSSVRGFGLPGAESRFLPEGADRGGPVSFRQRLSGTFWEIDARFEVRVAEDVAATLRMTTRDGGISLPGGFRPAGPGEWSREGGGPPLRVLASADRVIVRQEAPRSGA